MGENEYYIEEMADGEFAVYRFRAGDPQIYNWGKRTWFPYEDLGLVWIGEITADEVSEDEALERIARRNREEDSGEGA